MKKLSKKARIERDKRRMQYWQDFDYPLFFFTLLVIIGIIIGLVSMVRL